MTIAATKTKLEVEQLELKVALLKKELDNVNDARSDGEFQLIGGVVEERVHRLMDQMNHWSRLNPNKPIRLMINTQGGSVIDGFALYDFLQMLKARGHHLTTIGVGIAASMGSLLLQAGDERIMTKRCWMLIHEIQGLAEGSFSEMTNVLNFNKDLQEQGLDIYTERGVWTRATFKKKWKDDLWMKADAALKAGLIDRVEGT